MIKTLNFVHVVSCTLQFCTKIYYLNARMAILLHSRQALSKSQGHHYTDENVFLHFESGKTISQELVRSLFSNGGLRDNHVEIT